MSQSQKVNPIMQSKRGIVFGVANDMSIAWGISKALHAVGAEIALSYYGQSIQKRVNELKDQIDCNIVCECDVSNDESIENFFKNISQYWESIDFIVHSVAFSDKDQLRGLYINTTRENFKNTLDISCFSLTAITQKARKMMKEGTSILTLSFIGAEKVIPHYNVMGVAKAALEMSARYLAADLGPSGIRVNTISSGPIRTLAASGIGDFRYIFKWNEENAPLKRNVTIDEVGQSAVYLLSDMSSGVTGQTIYVDSGYNITGMIMSDHYKAENETN
ncbi:enoyl-ACP reductase FabI [Candidatus Gromoviella agglomerans]|uniref:enoyl-ACP reductase FabI n=1 Tax=Candidatus Gromoviella agglomerans TaxID=2806609 RepID=UPI001E63FEA9|nr:SDR family oxidoreductase [Candidatus Gromoviella agglomerans]UFX98415.1 Enoyl-ACP reductase FabI [Candidatus Gromoviella agglomerans]